MTVTTSISTGNSDARRSALARRALDVALASVALVALSPVMIAIAIAIKREDGGPLLFSHRRLGLGGEPFYMHKFRKFRADCSANGLQVTLEGDARLTPVGRFLRATKLDELPQLWNVLVGEMSVIGPRPESTGYADCFKDGFEHVLDYKPGILGPAQVRFRDEGALLPDGVDVDRFYREVLFPAKARIDLEYYEHRTLVRDIGWLIEGVLATLNLKKHPNPLEGIDVTLAAIAPTEEIEEPLRKRA